MEKSLLAIDRYTSDRYTPCICVLTIDKIATFYIITQLKFIFLIINLIINLYFLHTADFYLVRYTKLYFPR